MYYQTNPQKAHPNLALSSVVQRVSISLLLCRSWEFSLFLYFFKKERKKKEKSWPTL